MSNCCELEYMLIDNTMKLTGTQRIEIVANLCNNHWFQFVVLILIFFVTFYCASFNLIFTFMYLLKETNINKPCLRPTY